MYIRSSKNRKGRRIVAEEEVQTGSVSVAEEATELVFETEDVAELIAEITSNDVEVEADENAVTFTVGDTDYTVESEGNEEIMESSSRNFRGKRPVRANRSVRRSPVSASTRRGVGRTVRRVGR